HDTVPAPNALLHNTSSMRNVVIWRVRYALLFFRNGRIKPVEETSLIRTCTYTDPSPYASKLVYEHNTVFTIVIRPHRTHLYARRVLTVLARNRHEDDFLINICCTNDLNPWLVAFIFWFAPSRRNSHLNCASLCALHASVAFLQINYPNPFLDVRILDTSKLGCFRSRQGLKVSKNAGKRRSSSR